MSLADPQAWRLHVDDFTLRIDLGGAPGFDRRFRNFVVPDVQTADSDAPFDERCSPFASSRPVSRWDRR